LLCPELFIYLVFLEHWWMTVGGQTVTWSLVSIDLANYDCPELAQLQQISEKMQFRPVGGVCVNKTSCKQGQREGFSAELRHVAVDKDYNPSCH
jgi:hypothetical protein